MGNSGSSRNLLAAGEREKAIAEISKRTGCNDAEAEKRIKEFLKYSKDGRTLDYSELKKWIQTSVPSEHVKWLFSSGTEDEYAAMFRSFDIDSNGTVDLLEFCFISFFLEKGGSLEDKMKMLFRMFDQDQSRSLTKDEVFLTWSKIGIYDFKKVDDLFARCDANNDGTISEDEWIAEMLANRETRAIVDVDTRNEIEAEFLKSTIPEDGFAAKTILGRRIMVNGFKRGDSVKTIKAKLASQERIPEKNIQLIFNGKTLQDSKVISECLEFQDTVQLVVV
eukprot:TRINITY_DN7986_c0_g3_i1.p1 TRINITY_DN7986_c0_g3~~TRINITY_DN7986_c0_g3_i1.p1  ORF type:complete len:279 (-),score=60.71 TRINITY_DN7986_c0_g3_i1:205-1041(-)